MSKRLFREVARLTLKPSNYQFVDNSRLMLSGNWSAEEFDKWVNSSSEPEQKMNM